MNVDPKVVVVVVGVDERRISVAPMGLLVRFWSGETWGRSFPRLYSVAAKRLKNDCGSKADRGRWGIRRCRSCFAPESVAVDAVHMCQDA